MGERERAERERGEGGGRAVREGEKGSVTRDHAGGSTGAGGGVAAEVRGSHDVSEGPGGDDLEVGRREEAGSRRGGCGGEDGGGL